MKNTLLIIGILLIIGSVIAFSYAGFTYTVQDKIAEIGSITITSDEQKVILFHPIYAVLSLLIGIACIIISRRK